MDINKWIDLNVHVHFLAYPGHYTLRGCVAVTPFGVIDNGSLVM